MLFISGSHGVWHAMRDLAIIQGGATSAIELTALRKPFIYFPIEKHFEQANVSRILKNGEPGRNALFKNNI